MAMHKTDREADARALKYARTEMTKRGFDIGRSDIQLRRGTLTVRGIVGAMNGSNVGDPKREMEVVGRVLRQRPDIKDVVIDCTFLN